MGTEIITTPFGNEDVFKISVEAGQTISEVLTAGKVPVPIWDNVVVTINGMDVHRNNWSMYALREEDVMSIFVIPLGGDDKTVLRLVAVVLVAVAAAYTGGATLAALEGAKVAGAAGWAAAASAAVGIVGTLAINALIPPPQASLRPETSSVANSYYLTGQSNRARFYETVPVVYGVHKMIANLATSIDIWNMGDSSRFSACYDFGLGGVYLSDFKAGDTALAVLNGTTRPLERVPVHINPSQPELGLQPVELDLVTFPVKSTELSISYDEGYDPTNPDPQLGAEGESTTATDTKEAVVELFYPNGVVRFTDDLDERFRTVQYALWYRPTGTTVWQVPPAGTQGWGEAGKLSFQISGGIPIDPEEEDAPVLTVPQMNLVDGATALELPGDWVVNNYPPVVPTVAIEFGAEVGFVDGFEAIDILLYFDNGDITTSEGLAVIRNPPINPNGFPLVPNTGIMILHNSEEEGYVYAIEPEFDPTYGGVPGSQRWAVRIRTGYLIDANGLAFQYNVRMSDVWNVNMNITEAPIDPGTGEPYPPEIIPPDPNESSRYQLEAPETYVRQVHSRQEGSGDPWTPDGDNVVVYLDGASYTIPFRDVDLYRAEFRESGDEWVSNGTEYQVQYYALKKSGVKLLIQQEPLVSFTPDNATIQNPTAQGPGDVIFIPIVEGPDRPPGHEDRVYMGFSIIGQKQQPGVVSIVIPFPTTGQYDIRIERLTLNPDKDPDIPNPSQYIDYGVWNRLTSRGITIDQDPRTLLNLKKQHTLMEVRFEANENIQGNVQQVSAKAHSRLRWYNNGWQPYKVTSNPAWIVLDILTGHNIQNHHSVPVNYLDDIGWVTDAQLDLAAFQSFAAHCDEYVQYLDYNNKAVFRKRYECNVILASDDPIIETCQSILSMCRAQLYVNQAGQISVMIDEEQTTPRQLFTPDNSWGFSGSRVFQEVPHAFDVKFVSPELGYNIGTTTVFRPGYTKENAELYEDLETFGCTNWHQASWYGMYQLAQAVIRNEVYTLNCDVENLTVVRGDLVHVQHDVPLTGGVSCLITQDVDPGSTLVYVDKILSEFPAPIGFTWRKGDGTIVFGDVTDILEGQNTLVLSASIDAKEGELIVVGTKKGEDQVVTDPYIITEIIPGADLTAEITMVKYDPDVLRTDWGTFPIWSPSFGTAPIEDTSLYIYDLKGWSKLTYIDRMPQSASYLEWSVGPPLVEASCANIIITYQKVGGGTPVELITLEGEIRNWTHEYPADDPSGNFGPGYYQITPVSTLGYRGDSQSIYIGNSVDRTPPAAPLNFIAKFAIDTTTTLTWSANTEPDMDKYLIYSGPNELVPYDLIGTVDYKATEFVILTNPELHYFIQAVDTSGNGSNLSHASAEYPTPTGDLNLVVNMLGTDSHLSWTPLNGQKIDYYELFYNPDDAAPDPGAPNTEVLGTAAANQSTFGIEPRPGSYFIIATNIYGLPSDFDKALGIVSATFRDGLFWSNTDEWQLDRRTRLDVNGYISGQSYQRGDEVTNGSQISEAIIDGATEYPFITPVGDAIGIFDGTLSELAFDAKFTIAGNRMQMGSDGFIVGYQLDVRLGNQYSTYFIADPLGTPLVQEIDSFTADTTGVVSRPIPPSAVNAGAQFDMICRISEPAPEPITFTAPWNYDTPNNPAVPLTGQCSHANTLRDSLRFHKTDSDGIADAVKPPEEQLANLEVGDTIEMGAVRWSIQQIVDNGTWFDFTVAPAVQSSPDGIATFTFETVSAVPITVTFDLDWWTTSSYIGQGIYGNDTQWSDIVPDTNFYMIQPVFQAAHVPTEWHVKVYADSSVGGGAGEFVPAIFEGPGTTGYVPDPVNPVDPLTTFALTSDALWTEIVSLEQGDDRYTQYPPLTPAQPLWAMDGATGQWSQVHPWIDFADGDGTAWQEGRLFYDEVENAMSYYNDSSDVTVNMGQELVAKVRNRTGATIPNGSAVRVVGATGNRPDIALADASLPSTSRVVGVTTHDIANNSDGYITLIGVVRGFDTSAYAEGDRLYLSDTVPGGMTTEQTAFSPQVAIVTVAQNVNGWLYVKPERLDLSDYWEIFDIDMTASWNQRIRMETPPNSVTLPPPDQIITEVVSDIVIWNNSRLSDQYVTIIPAPGTYFTFDGGDTAVDAPLTLSPGEICRITTRVTGTSYGFAIEAASGFDGAGTFGFVRDPGTESGKFLSDAGTWQGIVAPPVGGLQIEYKFSTSIAGNPASGYTQLNTVDPALATEIHINKTTLNGNTLDLLWGAMDRGDIIWYQDQIGGNTYGFKLDGPEVDNGTWVAYPLSLVDIDGSIPNDQEIKVALLRAPENKLPPGGSENWVLAKASAADYDTEWQDLENKFTLENVPQDGFAYTRYWDGDTFEWHTGRADNVKFNGYSNVFFQLYRDGLLSMRMGGDSAASGYITAANDLYTMPARHNIFWSGGSERMRIDSSGNVGIGTTAPAEKLEVNGNIFADTNTLSPQIAVGNFGTKKSIWLHDDNGDYGGGTIFGTPAAADVSFITNDTIRLNVNQSGNVGIGTSSPSELMQLNSNDAANVYSKFTNASAPVGLDVGITNTGNGLMWHRDAMPLRFGTSNTERMRIEASGSVGIGTTAPLNKLHINGGAIRQQASTGQLMIDPTYTRHANLTNVAMLSTNTSTVTSPIVVKMASQYNTATFYNVRVRISRNYNNPIWVDVWGYNNTATTWSNTGCRCNDWGIVSKIELGFDDTGRPCLIITPRLDWRNYVQVIVESASLGWTGADVEDRRNPDNWESRFVSDLTGYNITTNVTLLGLAVASGNSIQGYRFSIDGTTYGRFSTAGVFCLNASSGSGLTSERMYVSGNVNVTGNYYVNGVPISSFIDAPADGNIYGRKDNAWTSLGSGTGTVSDLGLSRTTTTNTITNTGGDNVTLQPASSTLAGVMTRDDKQKLDAIQPTDLDMTRNSTSNTVTNSGGTDATLLAATSSLAGVMTASDKSKLDGIEPNANDYDHPNFTARSLSMTGATVPSAFTSNNEGHVTGFTTRTMTPADIGAAAESDIPSIAAGVWTPTLTTATGSYSAEGSWVTLGNLVMLYGRITANANLSGSSQCRVGGLPFQCDLINTGCAMGYQYIANRNSDGNGFEMVLNAGSSQIDIYGIGGSGGREHMRGQDISAGAHIQINIMYYSSDVPTV